MGRLREQRSFLVFLVARVAAGLAIQMQVVAVGWQMYALTDSAMSLGLIGLVQFAPSLLLMLVTGPVVDRFNRRHVLAFFRSVEALASASLALDAWLGAMTPTHLYLIVLIIGTARAFEMPAGQALLPRLVPVELLPRAIALSTATNQAATIAGPAVGGLLYLAGPSVVYASSCVLFALAALLIAFVAEPRTMGVVPRISLDYLLGGFRFIRGRPVIFGAVTLDMVAVLLGGATALLPIYARDILHTGPEGLGMLRAAPAVGALLTALWLSRNPLRRRVGRTMFVAVAGYGLATLVFAASSWLPLSLVALAAAGATDMISVVIRQSLVQIDTPDDMRGRVSGVNAVFVGASNQLGEFESGALAAVAGPVGAVAIGGVATLATVLLWRRWFPALYARDRSSEPGPAP